METTNADELKKLNERLEEASNTEGESEISDALEARAKVRCLTCALSLADARTGPRNRSAESRTRQTTEHRLVHRHRLLPRPHRLLLGDSNLITSSLSKAEACVSHSLIEEGGDWDRRDCFKVYTGLHVLTLRQFKRAGELLCDALSTFAATELLSYNDFVALTVSRVSGFVDSELFRFIATGWLHASIDKVHGIVETTRPSIKHTQYQSVIRQGDVLLDEVQRLSK
ncbi:hypothetical protein C0993_007378, partial [Termitomyces sp. T159_Od127]